ncbi:hypothetical protein SF23_00475 [Streptomyces sp. MBRL 10]|nr:hypothetical protein SF23_00475 [Streptomyces sp. MBRL 10]
MPPEGVGGCSKTQRVDFLQFLLRQRPALQRAEVLVQLVDAAAPMITEDTRGSRSTQVRASCDRLCPRRAPTSLRALGRSSLAWARASS